MKERRNSCSKRNEITWNLDENGVLTIEGQNKIPDYDCGYNSPAPWKDVRDQIVEIHILGGITEIGIKAFKDCEKLERAVFPYSLWRIYAYAFWNCRKLVSIDSDVGTLNMFMMTGYINIEKKIR